MDNTHCATISFFRFEGLTNKIWGFSQLLNAKLILKRKKDIEFFKALGTGSGLGYRAWPQFGVIGILIVWKNRDLAQSFLESSYFQRLRSKSEEQFTIFMQASASRGTWSGFGDWQLTENNTSNPVICALTRATIKRKFLFEFWKMVPEISKKQHLFPGLIFSQGVGEVPLLEQATFTIWENKQQMEAFAFNTFHGKAVEKVRKVNGFREQMFTRFEPIMTHGTWNGKNILEEYGVPIYQIEKNNSPVLA